ncbi:DNA replication licensing factor Mcm6 [Hamiltosporidium magnivora]|uniref:DNA helicase n=1 Tax=Hamiltosporidium magnivora TaxID=148818 RepID=A0A4Q9LDB2_9MICR|nr:DNA replication licensing factor Mcm6 [Hamiltosporidium magnivora]
MTDPSEELQSLFYNFLTTEPYKTKIKSILLHNLPLDIHTVPVSLTDIQFYSSDLYSLIVQTFSATSTLLISTFNTIFNNSTDIKLIPLFVNNPFIHRMRHLRSILLSKLTSFSGTVTRVSQVRPELSVGCFVCKACNATIQDVQQYSYYTLPSTCPNHLCTNRKAFSLETSKCIFLNWQKVTVQEDTHQTPPGTLPRNIEVILRNHLIESVKPGDKATFTGTLTVVPEQPGFIHTTLQPTLSGITDNEKKNKNIKEINYRLSFVGESVEIQNEQKNNFMNSDENRKNESIFNEENFSNSILKNSLNDKNRTNNFTNYEFGIISHIKNSPDLYNRMSDSLFPSIHGHSSIKKAILLLLVGGTSKAVSGGRLRGDINILLVGDPGTAKSQFLKQCSTLVSRGVYTSGKGSSAAGLTASVVRDIESGDFTIEPGALMLADTGVCCIDEFDKMNYKDQVSIHEAMEQQTITINKGGINATLNSRTSVLAACNPVHGRYDKKKSLRQNINMSAPIMSRFDLYFVLIDNVNYEADKEIAEYILRNHYEAVKDINSKNFQENEFLEKQSINTTDYEENSKNNKKIFSNFLVKENLFDLESVKLYLKYVRGLEVVMEENVKEILVKKYVKLRMDSLVHSNNYRMTVRVLESLIRLSEALSKLHGDVSVKECYVEEAYRLVMSSVVEVKGEDLIVEKEDGNVFRVKDSDYMRVVSVLVGILKMREGCKKEELVELYLEEIENCIGDEGGFYREKSVVEEVICYLVEKEGVLYEEGGIIFIHPNYDVCFYQEGGVFKVNFIMMCGK